MFKSRKKATRKCRENRLFTDRDNGRVKKLEGVSNFTSKRLTIAPGFLCLGIKSDTIQKSPGQQNDDTQRDYILNGDLHGFLNNNLNSGILKPRRSSRILKKIERTQNTDEVTASDYYPKILTQDVNSLDNRETDRSLGKNKSVRKNKCNSLFLEINKRCSRVTNKNFLDVDCPVSSLITTSKIEFFRVDPFCKNLFKQVRKELQKNNLLDCKLAISEKSQNINNILFGKLLSKVEMDEGNPNNKNTEVDRTDEEEPIKNFGYLPKCEWVFETPPRQRIMMPKIDECAIQPAVICTTKKQSNIYELNPQVTIDFNNYTHKQNVEVDRRYLKHLGSFENKLQNDCGINVLESRNHPITDGGMTDITNTYNYFQNREEYSNAKFNFANPFINASGNHYVPSLSRPSKTTRIIPRTNNLLKRKLEEFESTPPCSNHRQVNEYFEGDFTFIEENGKFKLMNTQCSMEENRFNFENERGNVFKAQNEEENMFNFNIDEQKVFDFTQLKRDGC